VVLDRPFMKKPLPLPKTSLLGRIGLALTSVLAIVAGFAVASVLFTVLLVVGLAFGGWLWWQFRRLARQARKAHPGFIEGEYTVVSDPPVLEHQPAPVAKPRQRSRRTP
jgi:hypothetical protein